MLLLADVNILPASIIIIIIFIIIIITSLRTYNFYVDFE
jgi:hypothetical protein